MSEANPDDILGYSQEVIPENRIVTQSSAKVDEGVKTLEDKVISWQDIINYWRGKITKNKGFITVFCVVIGMFFSWAVNRCTGNFDIPISVYVLSAVIVVTTALLLIADGALPLIVLVKFAVAAFAGHYFMMWIASIDGHYFQLFTTNTCRYPFSVDMGMVFAAGSCAGYIGKSFEEIRAARRAK